MATVSVDSVDRVERFQRLRLGKELSVAALTEPLDVKDFYCRYLFANQPVLLKRFVTENWPARADWSHSDGSVNVNFMWRLCKGSQDLPVSQCDLEEFSSHPVVPMSSDHYFGDYWPTSIARQKQIPILYLKDWHFQRLHPEYQAYSVPEFFASDWLNEYCLAETDNDYRFVYLGPRHSWTPFHCDVFGSYSWSANIAGRKLWLLLPPGEEETLRSSKSGRLPWDLGECSSEILSNLTGIRLIQEPGDVLFVPSGWHHQVANLEPCVSINHNWFNACNARHCHDRLLKDLSDVLESLSDVRDTPGFEEAVQSLLLAHCGLNIPKWFELLSWIFRHRMSQLNDREANDESVPVWLVAHDLITSGELLNQLLDDSNQLSAYLPPNLAVEVRELLKSSKTSEALTVAKVHTAFLD